MISRDDLPDTPEWSCPPETCPCRACQPTIPDNIELGSE